MSRHKLSIVGGGSPFVPSLSYAIVENKEVFDGAEVCLMDVDDSRLDDLVRLGTILAKRVDANVKFTWTTDAREALDGSTGVMLTYRVGGFEHMLYDLNIPTSLGISGDETTGPGGTFMAQCTIPVTLDYCRMIEELCPDAWVVSYINPANCIADAVTRESRVKFVSLCDCFAGFSMNLLPRVLDMPPYERRYCVSEDLHPRAIGINHMTWLVDFRINGEDGYPLLREKMREYQGPGAEDIRPGFMLRLLDAYDLVVAASGHVLPYWEQNLYMQERRESNFEERILGWNDNRWGFVQEMLAGTDYNDHPQEYCFTLSHARQAMGVLVSILANEGREWGGVHFVNNGAIKNLPSNAIVEGPVIADSRGITPIVMGDLPKAVLGVTQHAINWQELTVDAALSGDVNILYQALLACPYVHDMAIAKQIMDELMVKHADYMPQFSGSGR